MGDEINDGKERSKMKEHGEEGKERGEPCPLALVTVDPPCAADQSHTPDDNDELLAHERSIASGSTRQSTARIDRGVLVN